MKNILLLILALLVGYSCAEDNPDYEASTPISEAWICHNPGHDLHGQLCIEETNIVRGRHQPCFWRSEGNHTGRGQRDPNSFCWLLERRDCQDPLEYSWQKENCHFFGVRQE